MKHFYSYKSKKGFARIFGINSYHRCFLQMFQVGESVLTAITGAKIRKILCRVSDFSEKGPRRAVIKCTNYS